MKWIRERDELIAQTMAFVQSVTSRTNGPAPVTTPAGLSRDDTVVAAALPRTAPTGAAPPAETTMARPAPAKPSSDVRLEMHARIASFRKHQERFEREREEYCAATLTRLKAALREGGPKTPQRPPSVSR